MHTRTGSRVRSIAASRERRIRCAASLASGTPRTPTRPKPRGSRSSPSTRSSTVARSRPASLRPTGGTFGRSAGWASSARCSASRISVSSVAAPRSALYAIRDPLGVRPLCLGRKGDAWLVASETCALETVGAAFVRDVAPGEVLRIDDRGPTPIADFAADRRGLCVFEHVYLASVASDLGGVSVYATRERMGETLAEEHPATADVVIPVPDSAIPAAVGYARRSGIPFREGLIKNRYIGRTFIQPSPELRRQGVALKYNALRDVLDGRRVVVVDDSIVRGSTSTPIVELLRSPGAREVHIRTCSPPLRHQCFFGVDMARRDELIASRLDVEEIRRHIGADTLGYLSLDGMIRATGGTEAELCTACFTGDYLVPVQLELAKDSLEQGVHV